MVLSRVRLIRVRLVLGNLNPINDTCIQIKTYTNSQNTKEYTDVELPGSHTYILRQKLVLLQALSPALDLVRLGVLP